MTIFFLNKIYSRLVLWKFEPKKDLPFNSDVDLTISGLGELDLRNISNINLGQIRLMLAWGFENKIYGSNFFKNSLLNKYILIK